MKRNLKIKITVLIFLGIFFVLSTINTTNLNFTIGLSDNINLDNKNVKRLFGKVHLIAQCRDCKWSTENYKNGQATACIHAKTYKHKVNVEVGIAGYYDGRELDELKDSEQ